MIWLSGKWTPYLAELGFGVMITPAGHHSLPNWEALDGLPWAADAGTYANSQWFDLDAYLDWLESLSDHLPTCLFATVPDVFDEGEATAANHSAMIDIKARGYPAAYVLQPGAEATLGGNAWWELADWLFLGGPERWQRGPTAAALLDRFKRAGKRAHKGRVNSEARVRAALAAGFDSCDGTFLKFGPDANRHRVEDWSRLLKGQLRLPLQGVL